MWQIGLVGVVALYVVYFTDLSLDIHHGLGTSSYDSGLYDQGLWLMSRFDAPFVTLMGRNLFGDHTSFILLLLVPFYWLFPAAGTMFFAQSLVIGLGAVPVFLYARRALSSEAMALVLATAYLLHPAVGWTNIENFHPDSVLGVLVGVAIWAALERRWKVYVVAVALALLVKEDVALIIVPLGVWVALRRDRRIGVLTIVASLAFMAVAMLVVIRTLIGVPTRNAWRVPFGGPGGLLRTTFERPGDVVDHLRSDGRPWYVWQMLTPFAWVFLRRPSVALIGFVVLAANVVSTFWYQYHVNYHYSLVVVPALALGTAYAIKALGPQGRTYAIAAVGVVALYTAFLWGPLPFSRNELAFWPPDHPVAERMRDDHRGHPERCRRLGVLRRDAAPRPPRADLPVPQPVPCRALRARHEPRGHATGGPCRAGRVRRAARRPRPPADRGLERHRRGLRAGRGQRVVGAVPARRPAAAAGAARRLTVLGSVSPTTSPARGSGDTYPRASRCGCYRRRRP